MSVITADDLEQVSQELSPEEVDECDMVEPKQIDNVNSPFAHMMANLLQGGGRQGRSGKFKIQNVIELTNLL